MRYERRLMKLRESIDGQQRGLQFGGADKAVARCSRNSCDVFRGGSPSQYRKQSAGNVCSNNPRERLNGPKKWRRLDAAQQPRASPGKSSGVELKTKTAKMAGEPPGALPGKTRGGCGRAEVSSS